MLNGQDQAGRYDDEQQRIVEILNAPSTAKETGSSAAIKVNEDFKLVRKC
jgi:hypothetical protein